MSIDLYRCVFVMLMLAVGKSWLARQRSLASRCPMRGLRSWTVSATNQNTASAEEEQLTRLTGTDSKISSYWIDQLRLLERPVAKSLIAQLTPVNELGFDDGKSLSSTSQRSGSFLGYTIDQKKKHPDKVVLMRSGEFYETYGIDALMLINYAGLNPMGNKAKAGCPVRNVQATLDSLTSVGLSVAIYEEIAEAAEAKEGAKGAGKVKIKNRALTQIVSPASSTYIYDLCLRPDDIEFRENHPAVGLLRTTSGLTLCQVYLDEQAVVVTERLTEEGARALLANSGAIDPIYVQDVDNDALSAVLHGSHHHVIRLNGYPEVQFAQQVLQRVGDALELNTNQFREHKNNGQSLNGQERSRRPRPIYTSTALQIGLLPNDNVPSLIPCLLPKTHAAASARFWRKWLLNPPPADVADAMQRLCAALSLTTVSLPPFAPSSVGKVVSLLHARQGNVALFRDLKGNAHSLLQLLKLRDELRTTTPATATMAATAAAGEVDDIVEALLSLTTFLSGVPADAAVLRQHCERVYAAIDRVVADPLAPSSDVASDVSSSFEVLARSCGGAGAVRVPEEFFRRNEEEFRHKVRPDHPQLRSFYAELQAAAEQLHRVVAEDVGDADGLEISHDVLENALSLRVLKRRNSSRANASGDDATDADASDTDTRSGGSEDEHDGSAAKAKARRAQLISYVDRRGKVVSKRFTTQRLRAAIDDYVRLASTGPALVSRLFQALSTELTRELMTIVQTTHLAVALQATLAHTTAALQRGWTLPTLTDLPDDPAAMAAQDDWALALRGLTPYWIARDAAVANDIDLRGLFLLTAPNMSGKSTLMRAVLVAALLANAGCFIPATVGARVPRFDNFFLRTASYDVPSEAKSAFALEMDDMRVVLRDASHQSIVMIDELGKGTSAKDGAALAGALLEHLAHRQCFGIFATHLHELFLLPLQFPRGNVREKRMGYALPSAGPAAVQWTYQLEDGRCEDSMALVTATQYGIDAAVLRRAETLLQAFDAHCRPAPSEASPVAASTAITTTPTTPTTSQRTDAHRPTAQYLRDAVLPLLKTLEGLPTDNDAYVYIPPDYLPPPSIEGTSCVYLLHIYPAKKPGARGVFYVGETESLAQRLRQHRLFYRRDGGVVACVAFSAPHKSAARRLETQLIQQLKKSSLLAEPLVFERDADAKHSMFSRDRTKPSSTVEVPKH